MLKQITLTALFAAAALVSVPTTAAAADPNDACMLHNGCFWASGGGSDPGHWVCSDPAIYMLCLSPDGLVDADQLTLDPFKKD